MPNKFIRVYILANTTVYVNISQIVTIDKSPNDNKTILNLSNGTYLVTETSIDEILRLVTTES